MKRLQREDWDFSGISDSELEDAIYFEAIRTNVGLTKRILKYLDKSSSPSGSDFGQPEFPMHDDRARKFFQKFRPDRPWLHLSIKARIIEELSQDRSRCNLTITKIPKNQAIIEQWRKINSVSPNCRAVMMLIDLQESPKQLAREFCSWVRECRKAEGIKEKSRPGRKNARPFEKLKHIAAYRLHRAGLNYAEANKLVASAPHRDTKTDIRPLYTERAWYRAVKCGKALVEQMSGAPIALH